MEKYIQSLRPDVSLPGMSVPIEQQKLTLETLKGPGLVSSRFGQPPPLASNRVGTMCFDHSLDKLTIKQRQDNCIKLGNTPYAPLISVELSKTAVTEESPLPKDIFRSSTLELPSILPVSQTQGTDDRPPQVRVISQKEKILQHKASQQEIRHYNLSSSLKDRNGESNFASKKMSQYSTNIHPPMSLLMNKKQKGAEQLNIVVVPPTTQNSEQNSPLRRGKVKHSKVMENILAETKSKSKFYDQSQSALKLQPMPTSSKSNDKNVTFEMRERSLSRNSNTSNDAKQQAKMESYRKNNNDSPFKSDRNQSPLSINADTRKGAITSPNSRRASFVMPSRRQSTQMSLLDMPAHLSSVEEEVTGIWHDVLKPRDVKVFGVPIERIVLHVERWMLSESNIEMLVELSSGISSGKFYYIVFQRKINPKRTRSRSPKENGLVHEKRLQSKLERLDRINKAFEDPEVFENIKVREFTQLQAIYILKQFDNNLKRFSREPVKFNARLNKIDISIINRYLATCHGIKPFSNDDLKSVQLSIKAQQKKTSDEIERKRIEKLNDL